MLFFNQNISSSSRNIRPRMCVPVNKEVKSIQRKVQAVYQHSVKRKSQLNWRQNVPFMSKPKIARFSHMFDIKSLRGGFWGECDTTLMSRPDGGTISDFSDRFSCDCQYLTNTIQLFNGLLYFLSSLKDPCCVDKYTEMNFISSSQSEHYFWKIFRAQHVTARGSGRI